MAKPHRREGWMADDGDDDRMAIGKVAAVMKEVTEGKCTGE